MFEVEEICFVFDILLISQIYVHFHCQLRSCFEGKSVTGGCHECNIVVTTASLHPSHASLGA